MITARTSAWLTASMDYSLKCMHVSPNVSVHNIFNVTSYFSPFLLELGCLKLMGFSLWVSWSWGLSTNRSSSRVWSLGSTWPMYACVEGLEPYVIAAPDQYIEICTSCISPSEQWALTENDCLWVHQQYVCTTYMYVHMHHTVYDRLFCHSVSLLLEHHSSHTCQVPLQWGLHTEKWTTSCFACLSILTCTVLKYLAYWLPLFSAVIIPNQEWCGESQSKKRRSVCTFISYMLLIFEQKLKAACCI